MADYIPSKEADFLEWVQDLSGVCTSNKTAWNLPTADVTVLSIAVTAFAKLRGKRGKK